MGKKRTRVPGQPHQKAGKEGDITIQHSQTLEEDVREQRDVQFAAEKREVERSKRRKFVADSADTSVENAPTTIPASSSGNSPADARKAGLEMWRRNAIARKKAVAVAVGNQRTEAKIVEEARLQRAEIRAEQADDLSSEPLRKIGANTDLSNVPSAPLAASHSDDSDVDVDYDDRPEMLSTTEGDDSDALDFLDGSKITEEDELALSLFSKAAFNDGFDESKCEIDGQDNTTNPTGGRVMLADIILQKIREKEEEDARAAEIAADPEKAERDRKIAHVYGLVGNIMSKYRSGKVPKAFKVIPKVRNWQHLVHLTRPDEWSPAAMFVATRLLASNLPAKEVVPFYAEILLPRCLEDIAENKKLNYHLYRALSKALYKPDSFVKGILFPLCEDPMVTFRQATIISSVISKVSIPMLHSAAALLYLSQLPFSPTTCLVMTVIIEKNYALPYRVIDSMVDCFMKMKDDERPLPLLWHKCLLSFAQRFKTELTEDQKEKLKRLMRVHSHHAITPEVRRELFSAKNRGDAMEPDANLIAKQVAEAAMID